MPVEVLVKGATMVLEDNEDLVDIDALMRSLNKKSHCTFGPYMAYMLHPIDDQPSSRRIFVTSHGNHICLNKELEKEEHTKTVTDLTEEQASDMLHYFGRKAAFRVGYMNSIFEDAYIGRHIDFVNKVTNDEFTTALLAHANEDDLDEDSDEGTSDLCSDTEEDSEEGSEEDSEEGSKEKV